MLVSCLSIAVWLSLVLDAGAQSVRGFRGIVFMFETIAESDPQRNNTKSTDVVRFVIASA